MVTTVLRGGLGNQMFQYAAGKAIARKYGTELLLDTTVLNDRFPRKEITFRKYDLDIFTLTPRFTLLSGVSERVPVPGLWLAIDLALANLKSIMGIKKLVREAREFIFDPAITAAGGNITLWGHWQTPKYFDAISAELRKDFSFRHPLEGEAAAIAKDMAASNAVSLHVRRGDYVAFQGVAAMMGDTNLAYYAAATRYMMEHVKDPRFFVFSDDIAWCKENIKLDAPVVYVPDSSSGPKASFHLELMSRAKHNIIANSTFSWWGAWLNPDPSKIVIAPKQWMKGIATDSIDIVPENWIRL